MTQMTDASLRAPRRPRRSQSHPAQMDPTKLPADMEAVMPPCSDELGLLKYSRYWSLPARGDMCQRLLQAQAHGVDVELAGTYRPRRSWRRHRSRTGRLLWCRSQLAPVQRRLSVRCFNGSRAGKVCAYVDIPDRIHGWVVVTRGPEQRETRDLSGEAGTGEAKGRGRTRSQLIYLHCTTVHTLPASRPSRRARTLLPRI